MCLRPGKTKRDWRRSRDDRAPHAATDATDAIARTRTHSSPTAEMHRLSSKREADAVGPSAGGVTLTPSFGDGGKPKRPRWDETSDAVSGGQKHREEGCNTEQAGDNRQGRGEHEVRPRVAILLELTVAFHLSPLCAVRRMRAARGDP